MIATKGGLERPGPDKWVENGRPEYLRQNLEDSLKRLRVKRIDLWQLHRIDPKVPAEEQFAAVAEFQREGLIRHVGLSEVTVADIEQARKVVPIVSVQNLYNVTDRKWEKEVDYCEREGLAFIPWFPLSAGTLVDTPRLHEVAERHGATVFQDCAGLAAGSLAGHAGDSRDVVGGASGGERGGRRDQTLEEGHEGAGSRLRLGGDCYIASMPLASRDSAAPTPPMLKHWREVKAQHPDAILFYRVGDFYEMFHEDAELAARILDITLTSRGDGVHSPACR